MWPVQRLQISDLMKLNNERHVIPLPRANSSLLGQVLHTILFFWLLQLMWLFTIDFEPFKHILLIRDWTVSELQIILPGGKLGLVDIFSYLDSYLDVLDRLMMPNTLRVV